MKKNKYVLYLDGVAYKEFNNIFSVMLYKFRNIKWLIEHDYKFFVKI